VALIWIWYRLVRAFVGPRVGQSRMNHAGANCSRLERLDPHNFEGEGM
jgi:hypothetical protein